MKRNREIRRTAKRALTGKRGALAVMMLVGIAISSAISVPNFICTVLTNPILGGGLSAFSFGSVVLRSSYWALLVFVGLPLGFGLMLTILGVLRKENVNPTVALFRNGFAWNYWRGLGCSVLVTVFTFLWMLLLIVPGIIKGIAYSMTYFIAKDNPELSVFDCIQKSRMLMRGHKGRYFALCLSFIGWVLLGILSFGIAMLWIGPYIYAAKAQFYEDLKAEKEPAAVEPVAAEPAISEPVAAEPAQEGTVAVAE